MTATSITSSERFRSLSLASCKAWLIAALFIAGNIILPQLCHLIPRGGLIFLPIYFFTLIGAFKYGRQVGLLTAVASPLINSALFGMPMPHALPIIILKGVFLAIAAGYAARRFGKATLPVMIGVVLAYQLAGCAVECGFEGSFLAGVQDFRLGLPGMLLQVFGGWAILNIDILRNKH